MNAVLTPARLGALAAVAALSLSACASADEPGEITITDPWVKAAESGMTAAFGDLTNGTDETVVLVSVDTSASPTNELHETLSDASGGMSMSQKEGGFEIAPGEKLTLEPGGNHVMMMDVTEPIEAGDTVDFTLTFEDGSTFDFTADAKDYTGAQESYTPQEPMDMDS
ncbi:copper chaperone PCu(A)C [Demequina sp. NBRC 110055]|uniref:copper chaperone PCu(A)C n=1 Tax=Demequina sp. NBRC 110055 TaxID=1570344 RepID=UPI000A03A8CE|nr:copper chaperone PCu(A)C [Demequina sp. NBRC 110055]